jgi:hypothetical protein
MFVQVIKGRTSDAAGLRRKGEAWATELGPGAAGYLGGTFGIAEDGTFFVFARFVDETAARASSDRPEQGAWWAEISTFIDGEPSFRESSDVTTLFGGGSDAAGFVQVLEGTVSDRAKVEAFEASETMAQLQAVRPDILGSMRVWLDGGAFVEAVYFTSEDAARSGEASDAFTGSGQEYDSLFGEMTFTDLRDPSFNGPTG